MILAAAVWLVVGVVVVGVVLLVDLGGPPPDAHPPRAHPHASMRVLFVTTRSGRLVLDGLLDLDASSTGIPTTWAFACPSNLVIAAATIRVLERWAEDGESVTLDLSKVSAAHPSVAFTRDDVLVRLSVTPRTRHASEPVGPGEPA